MLRRTRLLIENEFMKKLASLIVMVGATVLAQETTPLNDTVNLTNIHTGAVQSSVTLMEARQTYLVWRVGSAVGYTVYTNLDSKFVRRLGFRRHPLSCCITPKNKKKHAGRGSVDQR